MNRIKSWVITVLLTLAAGCAALGVPTAETFNQRALATISAVTEIRSQALTLLKAKKITPDDAENVLKQTDAIREGVVIARSLHSTNPKAGEDKLALTRAGIAALQAYLATKQGGNP